MTALSSKLLAALLLVMACMALSSGREANAYACTSDTVNPDPTVYKYRTNGMFTCGYVWVASPADACITDSMRGAMPSGAAGICAFRVFGGAWEVCTRYQVGGTNSCIYGVTGLTGSESCWNAAMSSYNTASLPHATADGFGTYQPSGCAPCPAGQSWDAGTMQCELPSCPEGETYDEAVSACRASCLDTEVYIYETASCKLQCPVGKTSSRQFVSNMRLQVTGEVFTVNGCPATANVQCSADTEGYFLEHHGAAHVTGQICKIDLTYSEDIQETVEFQVIYEDALDGELGYSGESDPPVLDGEVQEPEIAEWHIAPDLGVLTNRKYVCRNGTAAWVYEVDGVEGEITLAGACPLDNTELDPEVTAPTAIAPLLQGIAEGQEEQLTWLQAIGAGIIELQESIDTGFENLMSAIGGDDETTIDDLDPPDVGTLYTPEFTSVQDAVDSVSFSQGPLGDFFNDAVPTFAGITPDECISWDFTLPFIGAVHFEPPCMIWDTLGTFMMGLATVGSWIIIFS